MKLLTLTNGYTQRSMHMPKVTVTDVEIMGNHSYGEAAQAALAFIVLASRHQDADQRNDMLQAAGRMFWHAARASAFRTMREKGYSLLKNNDHTEEVIAIANAAINNIESLGKAIERCHALSELLKTEEPND